MRVAVVGAGGRMGREVCRTVQAHAELDLVAAVDPLHAGSDVGLLIGGAPCGLVVTGELEALIAAGTEVVVDFSRLAAARETLAFCAGAGIHAVVGTTGFTEVDLAELALRFDGQTAGAANCVVAANFAIGAVLMMKFAEMAAPWFEGAEIVESHHDGKLDAPSGTAMRTAERMAAGRAAVGAGDFPPDRTFTAVLEGARGAGGPGGVRIHSLRLAGLVAHQDVVFGGVGQSLTIRHDSYDRSSFMDGVVLAVRSVGGRPGLTVGLEPLLGL
ncbi:MAG TPA: 4-hydroxy-tetrahydrodipicolinate reductase [Acidimicrobiales bacterium]|nr:4-hydroxy-tetrahydrodipicolinate reductase [Acidimicrobiales bacterium]